MIYNVKQLYSMDKGVRTRWASPENFGGCKGAGGKSNGGRKGSAAFTLRAGKQKVLAEEKDVSGVVRRIWVTLSNTTPVMLRSLKLEFYWDGSSKPAVCVPLGDFFGTGLGRTSAFESTLFSSPEGRSFNCFIPMPFKKGMKITVTNESCEHVYYFHYDIDYTLGDEYGDDMLYFHAFFNCQNPTSLQQDYQILSRVVGSGRFLGANIGVQADQKTYFTSWWGEGECKIYIDGDSEYPTLCGTGTEDYIGTGWELGSYSHMYQGCHYADRENMVYCFYRYHIPDPVYFEKDIRVTMQQIGSWRPDVKHLFKEAGRPVYHAGPGRKEIDFLDDKSTPYGLFERSDNWSSCAYFYLDKCENNLPEMKPVEERVRALPEDKEMVGLKMEPECVRVLKKYIPEFEKLEKEDFESILKSCEIIIESLKEQELEGGH